jgi:hypothetical protein
VLGNEADRDGRLYLTGGATAVLLGWRPSTIDSQLYRYFSVTDARIGVQRAEAEGRRADAAEAEVARLRALLAERGQA